MGFGDYLDHAGGVTEQGHRSGRFLFFRSDPKVEPGSTITVPVKQPDEGGGFNVDQWLTRMLSIATIVVALTRIN